MEELYEQPKTPCGFSIEDLRNPEISLDRDKSGQYTEFLQKASSLLRKVIQKGFWTQEAAEQHAAGYKECKNAFEVMQRNTLVENIVEDRPMDMSWEYHKEENKEVYQELDQIIKFDELNALSDRSLEEKEKYEEVKNRIVTDFQHLFEDRADVTVNFERVYEGFWRITFSRVLDGEDYSFSVNIDTGKKSVALLSYIPPTEIIYAFGEFKTTPLLRDLLEKHPRLNIQLPPGIEKKIQARRRKEREYQKKVTELSDTKEIAYTTEIFESGVYVPQGKIRVIPAIEGPIGTTGVGPCVVICAKGRTNENKLMLGFAHMEAVQDELSVLDQLQRELERSGVPNEQIEMFLVGGWKSTEELQKRLLALSERFLIKGILINLKDKNMEYPEKKNYIDVVIDQEGNILYGENGEVFKIEKK